MCQHIVLDLRSLIVVSDDDDDDDDDKFDLYYIFTFSSYLIVSVICYQTKGAVD